MSLRSVVKAAIEARKAGKTPDQVFQEFSGQVTNQNALAVAIASVPDPTLKKKWAPLNYVLFALLVFAAITKAISALAIFQQYGIAAMLAIVLLGVFVPAAFAIAVITFDGRSYPILVMLCVVNALNVALKTELGSARWLDVGLLGVIAVLAYAIKRLMFP
ncbi:MAG TPA: hypothetical protein VFW62_06310, partial [bacterium]|nr:hypothetical protein [bacterium]